MKNKKVLVIPGVIAILVIALALLMIPEPEAPVEGHFTYTVEKKQVTIKSCDPNASGEIIVPAELDGYPVVSIGSYAFHGCSKITKIVLPEGIIDIQMYAFENCTGLTSLTIPRTVTSIDPNALNTCASLKGIWVDSKNPNYSSDDYGVLFNKDKTTLLRAPMTLKSPYNIPESVTTIGDRAFLGCANLNEISIPDTISALDWYAFSNCIGLTTLILPESIQSIGYDVFKGCTKLEKVCYKGSEDAWKLIAIKNGNNPLLFAKIIYDYCEHVWDFGTVTKEPTCKDPGVNTYSCRLCGTTKREGIPKLHEHTWDEGAISRAPTCKDPGITTFTCIVCQDTMAEEIERLTTHTWNGGVTTKEPTCKETGTTTYTCTFCGETKDEAIERLTTHTPGPPATDEEDQICTVCGKVLVPATKEKTFLETVTDFFDSIAKFFEDAFTSFFQLFGM